MAFADIDPSLCAAEPLLETLDDGFTHPALNANTNRPPTHPVEPDPFPPGTDTPVPNPSQLPIEPEFGPALPQPEPEDPGVPKPVI
jgi:hypothetical protein